MINLTFLIRFVRTAVRFSSRWISSSRQPCDWDVVVCHLCTFLHSLPFPWSFIFILIFMPFTLLALIRFKSSEKVWGGGRITKTKTKQRNPPCDKMMVEFEKWLSGFYHVLLLQPAPVLFPAPTQGNAQLFVTPASQDPKSPNLVGLHSCSYNHHTYISVMVF